MNDQRWQYSDKIGNKQETVSYIMRERRDNDCQVPRVPGSSLPIVEAAANSKCISIAPPHGTRQRARSYLWIQSMWRLQLRAQIIKLDPSTRFLVAFTPRGNSEVWLHCV
ncbi:hypothetical protein J6590_009124 [Homalodisca vitripennis]|nr:hypothetical protein J6590_009124 [Homalodisca vitripennis]